MQQIPLTLSLSSSIVVEHLKSNYDHTTGLVWVYLNFTGDARQTLSNILGSLIKQLVQRRSRVPSDVRRSYENYQRGEGRPNTIALVQLLRTEISTYAKNFIIVAGLDEASTTVRNKLLEILESLDVNLFISSRSLTDTVEQFCDAIRVDMLAPSIDLKAFICYELSNRTLVSPLSLDSNFHHTIIEKMEEKSNGS